MNALRLFRPSFLAASILVSALVASAQTPGTILHAPEASKVLPDSVYYAGKSANTQLRNSAGVHFADGHYVLAVLVDTSGYSSTIQENTRPISSPISRWKSAAILSSPGAYGVGFVGDHFDVMGIGNHDVLQTPDRHDNRMQRPMPLQILDGDAPGRYRLCFGRTCVPFHRP